MMDIRVVRLCFALAPQHGRGADQRGDRLSGTSDQKWGMQAANSTQVDAGIKTLTPIIYLTQCWRKSVDANMLLLISAKLLRTAAALLEYMLPTSEHCSSVFKLPTESHYKFHCSTIE